MLSRWVRFLVLGPLLLLLLLVFFSWIPSTPSFIFSVVSTASVVALAAAAVFPLSVSCFLFGLSICILPFFHHWAGMVFVVCWLLGYELRLLYSRNYIQQRVSGSQKLVFLGFLSFLMAYILSLLHLAMLQGDFWILSTVYRGGGSLGLLRYLVRSFHSWGLLPTDIAGYVVSMLAVVALASLGRRETGVFLGLFRGLALGVFVSALILLFQVLDISPVVSYNRSAFWILTGQRAATFSDPNAFGIAVALLSPAFFIFGKGWRRLLYLVPSLLFLVAGFWSGSRSMWLGIVVWILCFIFSAFNRSQIAKFRFGLYTLLIIGFSSAVILGYPPLNDQLREKISGVVSAPTPQRVLKTLNWDSAREMLGSRALFWKMAIRAWKEQPIIGLGLGQFYHEQQRLAEAVGVDLKGWRDNANNYYLQLLSEQGLIGFLLVLYAFYQCACALSGRILSERFGEESQHLASARSCVFVSRSSLVVLLILLLTGPHLHFPEIRLIAAVFLALGIANVETRYESRSQRRAKELMLVTLLCPIALMFFGTAKMGDGGHLGLYQREHSAEDGFFVWSGARSRISLCPKSRAGGVSSKSVKLSLSFRALNPDLRDRPLTVRMYLRSEPESFIDLVLSNSAWKTIELSSSVSPGQRDTLEFATNRLWSPSQGNPEGDARWFGVMLKWPESACEGAAE